MNTIHRMPPKQRTDDKKGKGSSKDKDKGKSKSKHPKRRIPDSDSDSDVDSHGNIRDLIDYDYDSASTSDSDASYTTDTSNDTKEIIARRVKDSPPPVRRAAILARKKIRKELDYEKGKYGKHHTPSTTDSSYRPERKKPSASEKPKKVHRRKVPESESDSSSSSESSESEMESDDDDSNDSDFKEFQDDSETDEEGDVDDEDDSEDDDDDEDEDDDDDDEENDEGLQHGLGGNLILTLGGAGHDDGDRMIPQRYNMKKEPEIVRKFVKLITTPIENNTIDAQIDQFKALNTEKQNELITALENRPTVMDAGVSLMLRILTLRLPADIQAMILAKYNSLQAMDQSSSEYFKLRNWLDKVVSVPFGMYKEIPIRLEDGHEACAGFMAKARKALDDAIYGQDDTKLQILQFMSTKIANPAGRGMNLLLVGPPGIGKTSLVKHGIAKALDWPFQFISLGGDSDASTYNGHQLVYESSHCGKIVNSLVSAKSMSTILLFDEVDKVSTTEKGEEVQNLLIHMTDPAANGAFEDKYLAGVPIDLSRTMFIFSANDITKIDKVLLDRLLVIELKGYELDQKLVIAENYLLPGALRDVNLTERIAISKDILKYVIETYAREEAGVRELKRCIEQIVQKLNMLRMYNARELPFHIPNFSLPFVVKKEHVDLFLKKKEGTNGAPFGMYM